MTTDVEMESEGERDKEERKKKKKERSRSKEKERSRSRGRDKSKERDKRKHKKHKKDKKKHKKRDRSSEDDDTANEGGDTPEKKTPVGRDKDKTPELPDIDKLPGLGKYDSEEEGEIEEKKSDADQEKRKEYSRDEEREKRDERKEYQRESKRGGSKDRREGSKERDRKRRRSRSRDRERKRSGERGRDREKDGKDNTHRSERDKDRSGRDEITKAEKEIRDKHKKDERGDNKDLVDEPGEVGGGKEVMSLSIEETNKLRAKLGLKPLNVSNIVVEDENPTNAPGTLIPGDRDKTRHLVPQHWGERDQQKKLREKLEQKKAQRQIRGKLDSIKGLGDSDSDEDDASKWVERQKKKALEKEEAAKRAKVMEELDEEFGVQDIVDEDLKEKKQNEYSGRDLKGLRVEHSAEAFGEATTILTLQDQDILSDKYEDVLVNVNIIDNERVKKNMENIRAGKEGYQAYGTEEVDELTGEVKKKDLLYQYKEELEGAQKESFTLEGEGEYSEEVTRERELAKIRQKLRQNNAISLDMPAPKLATDYYTESEMMAFKKPKKKKKVRKKILKADDLLALSQESSLVPTEFGEKQKKRAIRIIDEDQVLPDGRLPDLEDHDDLPVVPDMTGMSVEKDDDSRAIRALKIARKLKKVKSVDTVAEEVLRDSRENAVEMEDTTRDENPNDLVIDQTKEFCRGLGDVGSYEVSGLGETVDKELLDFEKGLESERMRSAVEWSKIEDREEKKEKEKHSRGTWEEVDEEVVEEGRWKEGARRHHHRRSNTNNQDNNGGGKPLYRPAILEDEALAATGMGAALKMALQKGYLDAEEKKIKSTGLVHLKCKNYNIDDKSRDHEEDDRKRRGGGRDRGYQGPTSSFTEKKNYKPEVNLEYVDDTGRAMNAKEAFRFLSHKFHGKGSGKLKTEKRQRKIMEDKLMEKMSSTDTPLNTLTKLQSKTKELATPYLVLSGNKNAMGGHTSLKK